LHLSNLLLEFAIYHPSVKPHEGSYPGLVAHGTADVSSASGVFRQEYVTRAKLTPGTIADFYLHLTFQRKKKLSVRRIVPVEVVFITSLSENDSCRFDKFRPSTSVPRIL